MHTHAGSRLKMVTGVYMQLCTPVWVGVQSIDKGDAQIAAYERCVVTQHSYAPNNYYSYYVFMTCLWFS